jgi:site-specific recombinase XerD
VSNALSVGRVERSSGASSWVVIFPDAPHHAVNLYLRDLSACDCSPLTMRSYAYDLLRWLRFVDSRGADWQCVSGRHVREFVEELTTTPKHVRRSLLAPPTGSVNNITGKPYPGAGYAARTINHQLSVLHGFYSFACDFNLGPTQNPVPEQRTGHLQRLNAHHSPMEEFVIHRRATYRQKVPRTLPRSIPDSAATALFNVLNSHRDRALVTFYLSTGARASELLGLRHGWIDPGRRTIKVVSKGSRRLDEIPASPDAFVWLALYFAELSDDIVLTPESPVWWTLRRPRRPLNYYAARAVLHRANTVLGTNYSLHDFRHTAAYRLAQDTNFTLVEVQSILRHAHVATTQIYTQPRMEDLVEKVAHHHHRRERAPSPEIGPGYDGDEVRELLGLP